METFVSVLVTVTRAPTMALVCGSSARPKIILRVSCASAAEDSTTGKMTQSPNCINRASSKPDWFRLSRAPDPLHQLVHLARQRLFNLRCEGSWKRPIDKGIAAFVAALLQHPAGGNIAEHVVGISGDPGVAPTVF